MGLSRQRMKQTSSSIATTLKECNLIALAKDRKWILRRVRDVMVVHKPIRCDLPKLKYPMIAEMTKAEERTAYRHRTTHAPWSMTYHQSKIAECNFKLSWNVTVLVYQYFFVVS